MTDLQRANQVRASHDAARGRNISFGELCQRATSRQGNMRYNVAPDEVILGNWLRDLGLPIIHNFAVGPYNCDIGTGPITVEVWGGGWHPKPNEVERTKYILDAGYSVLIVDIDERRYPLAFAVTKYAVALHKIASSDPAEKRQYWMVRGNGECIFVRLNSDNITLKPPFTSSRNSTNGQYVRIPD